LNTNNLHGKEGYGNCVTQGLYLWYKLKFRGVPIIKTRPGTLIPHLMIKQKDCLWHFTVKENILPVPCHIFFFKGRYEQKWLSM